MEIVKGLFAVLLVTTIGGCASNATLDTSADAKRSFDGLYPFENTIVDRAWARADLDLSGYTKIKVEGAGIHYRPTSAAANSRLAARRGRETDFPIDANKRERLSAMVAEAFLNELGKLERFELTDQVGPDVLILRGGLLDVVSRVPGNISARVDVYLGSVGEATLILELIDSESNTVLLRAVDRRSADSQNRSFPSNSVSNWADVKRLAQFWARLLRERIDQLGEELTLPEDAV